MDTPILPLLLLMGNLLAVSPTQVAAAKVAQATELPAKEIHVFTEKYCADCHDSESKKGGLNFEQAPLHLSDREAFLLWEKVYDRVVSGEMPPRKKGPLPAQDKMKFLAAVESNLHSVSSATQRTRGRVPFRRMNRVEYENALHDLLGIATPLRDFLPEDSSVAGFDTISSALETSGVHLVRYQQAADRALLGAFDGRRPQVIPGVKRHTGREYIESRLPVYRREMDLSARAEGDSFVLYSVLYGDLSMQAPRPPVTGRYRVRAALRSVNTDKPMTALVARRTDRFDVEKLLHIIDYFDLPPGTVKVVEVETDLGFKDPNQFVYFEALGLPFFKDFQKQRNNAPLEADFAGPGLAVDWAEIEGPLNGDLGYRRLFGELPTLPRMANGKPVPANWRNWNPGEFMKNPLEPAPSSDSDLKAQAEGLVRTFLPLAFRRVPEESLVRSYLEMAAAHLDAGESFYDSMRATYRAILCSPHFLQYPEPPGALDGHALASRIARMLWSSIPDSALLEAAAWGKLSSPDGMRAEVARMLKDPKARRFSENFVGQWLDLRKFMEMKPDEIYVEWDGQLAWSMPRETQLFFDEVLSRNLPVSEFVHSDWTYLNQRLAKHYGVPDVQGLELRRVRLAPESHRGGVLTQGSVLKLTTNASYTSPVKRGVWMLERIIGKPPPPPPPDVKAVEPDIRGAVTIREQLDKHKEVAVCASCHAHIDPPGFALENFDVVGAWREFYRVKKAPPSGGRYEELAHFPGKKVHLAKQVESHGSSETGETFSGIDEFKQILLKDQRQLARNMLRQLIVYGTGAELQFADRREIETLLDATAKDNWGLRSLLEAAICSSIFCHK